MKPKPVKVEEVPQKEFQGLKDGGHVYPACSNCRALLMDIHVTRPDDPEEWVMRARCPWCGDKSFLFEVKGGLHVGGFGKIKEDDEDDTIPSTVVGPFEIVDGVIEWAVEKAGLGARPYTSR